MMEPLLFRQQIKIYFNIILKRFIHHKELIPPLSAVHSYTRFGHQTEKCLRVFRPQTITTTMESGTRGLMFCLRVTRWISGISKEEKVPFVSVNLFLSRRGRCTQSTRRCMNM